MYTRSRGRRWVFIPFAIVGMILFGWIVQLLWNNVAVPVLHVSVVTYWQGLGILVLSKILFSSFNGRGGGYRREGHWKQRMMWESMTPEQKKSSGKNGVTAAATGNHTTGKQKQGLLRQKLKHNLKM